MILPFTVIVPVYNESAKLGQTAPALKRALSDLPAQVIFALNGTTDNSRSLVEAVFGASVKILELPLAGKSKALLAADALAEQPIRLYLDADILVQQDTIRLLLQPLLNGSADLVAARLVADISFTRGLALRVSRVWADQLARRKEAFMCCTAISKAGLEQRGPWPDVLSDDDWARDRIAPNRRVLVESAKAYMSPPQNLRSWLVVRARWIRGARELKRRGSTYPTREKVLPRGAIADLAIYYIIRIAAEFLALMQQVTKFHWGRDTSTRGE